MYNNGTAPCNKYYVPTGKETCSTVMLKFSLEPDTFFGLNPGLNCDHLYPSLMRTDGQSVPAIGAQVRNEWVIRMSGIFGTGWLHCTLRRLERALR